MAKEKGRSPEAYDERKMAKGEDIISAATSLMRTESFEDGYPETFNPNMHINRGSPAVGRGKK